MIPARTPQGSGARRRAQLVRAGRLAQTHGLTPSRAQRFARRLAANADGAPEIPSLADLALWPEWPALPPEEQHRVFALAGVLASRDALGEIISGPVLRDYAQVCGGELFDRALALAGGGKRTLPPLEAIAGSGESLARSGLPAVLAWRLGDASAQDREAALHVAEAERLLGCAP